MNSLTMEKTHILPRWLNSGTLADCFRSARGPIAFCALGAAASSGVAPCTVLISRRHQNPQARPETPKSPLQAPTTVKRRINFPGNPGAETGVSTATRPAAETFLDL